MFMINNILIKVNVYLVDSYYGDDHDFYVK